MRAKIRYRWVPVIAAILAGSAVAAPAQSTMDIDYLGALRQARGVAGSVRGAELDAQAKELQANALRRIDGPDLQLTGFAGRLATTFNFDTSAVAQAANPLIGGLDAATPNLRLPAIPNVVSANRTFNLSSLGLTSIWPLYTGGKLQAVKGLVAARAQEARAELRSAEDQISTQIAQRYFTLQLARQAFQLRSAAVEVITDHQHMAAKMERIGLISRADHLKADVALDNAKREAEKSRSDAEIAQVALTRLLAAPQPVQPITPLFVSSATVGPLQDFIDAAMRNNAAWDKIASKRSQAVESARLAGSEHSPTIFAVGNYNGNRSDDHLVQPNWFVGLTLAIPIVGRLDHAQMNEAARLEQQRVEVAAEQAKRDIPTLVESQWRAVEDARIRFLSMQSAIDLAEETLRLARISFREGQATTMDVSDASVNLTKARVERVQAAYEYVMALARLLESCGQPARLQDYAKAADHIIPL
ncbi:MAG TPA: TolC family protein [Noviherbaspirillum sp.]|uniref:TolC family protein n=1 Tax=Noviherbaspirillum sp. TaxID=1926288 RepID=UPI002B486756|nr:TolC family protein [Noviherbaspirillum sp.]HJV84491.1 TolC family protein [Noviherbaspirillum sp.]